MVEMFNFAAQTLVYIETVFQKQTYIEKYALEKKDDNNPSSPQYIFMCVFIVCIWV